MLFDDRKPTLCGVYKTKHDFKYAGHRCQFHKELGLILGDIKKAMASPRPERILVLTLCNPPWIIKAFKIK